ncbi:MAG: polynucleotide adenylyltransferase PcnB [Desulfobulbaceae bacterium]|nr:polynucleotide adenylyltransferase PcnB [Desulfobulbaceae bacterium]
MAQSTKTIPVTDEEPEPIIIPRSAHSLSSKDIDRDALKVLSLLHKEGHNAYLVGGGVRDLYLGKTPKDFDISTDAKPGQIRKLFRNSRTIGRRFRLVQIFFHDNKIIEVSTFRCRSEYDIEGEINVLPANNTFGTEADDAIRRDLTINSLFYDIENETIIDYTGGVADLNNRIIRFVGDPDKRITRDPVRILRAIRHASRIGFSIEENAWQAIIRHRDKLHLCPISRIRDELLKDLRGGANRQWLQLLLDSGVFYVLFPFYQTVFDDNGAERQELLAKILAAIDRIHRNKQQLSEAFLLGLFLIPWAQKSFPEMQEQLKDGQLFSLSRRIKIALDTGLNHLNIKKATIEYIASLLARLNLFAAHDTDGKWPAWLKKKSYFRENSQFYMIYREASGGEAADEIELPAPEKKLRSNRQAPRRSGRTPAFTREKSKGGIFGLRKRK